MLNDELKHLNSFYQTNSSDVADTENLTTGISDTVATSDAISTNCITPTFEHRTHR